jgi:DNA-directed RNA polymerase specialized sigma24 family protein
MNGRTFPSRQRDLQEQESPKGRESHSIDELPEHAQGFASRFSRYRPLLYSLACRVLGGIRGPENALENTWRTASRNPPKFDYEGAFRSWLARVLIYEALSILRKNRELNVNSKQS